MIDPNSALNVAIASGAFSLAAVLTSVGLPILSKRRARGHRESIAVIRSDADKLDREWRRLNEENERLWNRVQSLEMAVSMERDAHEQERQEHEETRRKCAKMERLLRSLGHGGALDENGGSR